MKIDRFNVAIVVLFIMTSGALTYAYTGRIAYVSDRDGQNEIYLMEMDGSNQTRLTNSTYDDITPVFSPDGQRIAFFSNRSGSYKIYTMNWNGTGIQPVPNSECATGGWYAGRGLAWSPDGQKLLFKPTDSSLATINLDGSGENIVWDGAINGHDYIQGVEWGPTADDIYVNAHPTSWGYDQHVFRKSGNAWTQITEIDDDGNPINVEPLCSHGPQVSNYTSRIVLDRQEDWQGPANIYTMGLNGEDMVKLTFDTGSTQNNAPDWIANGNGIVFSSRPISSGGPFQIWLMDSTGANLQMLQGEGSNFAPSWTPVPEPAIAATVDIHPDTLNLQSKGNWITCHIAFPADADVADVNSNTILLNDQVKAEWTMIEEEAQVLMAKFSRSAVEGILQPGIVELTVSGKLNDGTRFEGKDTITVINKGKP